MLRIKWENLYGYEKVYSFIFPFFQNRVHTLVNIAKQNPRIEKLIVFGSILTESTGIDSDIDICLVGNIKDSDTKDMRKIDGTEVDIIICTQEELDSKSCDIHTVYREIIEKGLVVYGR